MKRKGKIAAAVVCVCLLVTVAYAAVSGAGTETDPLVTLSYLTNIFAPQVEELAGETVANQQEQNREELDSAIEEWDYLVQAAIDEAGVSGGSGAAFALVTLEAEQILELGEGCEVLLRSGAARWTADGQVMMDVTSGSQLDSGKALTANHLYMTLGEGFVTVVGGQTAAQPTQTTGTVTAGPLNVRSAPGGDVVGSVNEGDVVTIVATVDGWHQITIGSLSGYVSADYVTVNEAAPAPTPAPAASVTLMVRGTYRVQ